jgi:hypothetical protein
MIGSTPEESDDMQVRFTALPRSPIEGRISDGLEADAFNLKAAQARRSSCPGALRQAGREFIRPDRSGRRRRVAAGTDVKTVRRCSVENLDHNQSSLWEYAVNPSIFRRFRIADPVNVDAKARFSTEQGDDVILEDFATIPNFLMAILFLN